MQDFRDMRNTLYQLKRSFGRPVSWRRVLAQTSNDTTGIISTTNLDLPVTAIILPREQDANFSYTLTYLAMNKNFQYGALYDAAIQDFVFDSGDFPTDFKPSNTDKVVLGTKIYDVSRIGAFDIFDTAILVTAKYTEHGQE